MSSPAAIGIDIGSTTWKAVVVDQDGAVLHSHVEPTDPLIDIQTRRALEELKREAGIEGDLPIAATGYGRKRVENARILTEITCHAKGAFHHMHGPGILIDIGGQDTKVIHIDADGSVSDFAMNDKCAAGTGRFLEVIIERLHVPIVEVSKRVEKAEKAIPISSTCTVFAESEVVSLVAQGEDVNDILKGLHRSLSSRVGALAGNVTPGTKVMMSGGVALNAAMVGELKHQLGAEVHVLPQPQLVGALGAALAVL